MSDETEFKEDLTPTQGKLNNLQSKIDKRKNSKYKITSEWFGRTATKLQLEFEYARDYCAQKGWIKRVSLTRFFVDSKKK